MFIRAHPIAFTIDDALGLLLPKQNRWNVVALIKQFGEISGYEALADQLHRLEEEATRLAIEKTQAHASSLPSQLRLYYQTPPHLQPFAGIAILYPGPMDPYALARSLGYISPDTESHAK